MLSLCPLTPAGAQYRLHCPAGFTSDLPPVISCVNGTFQPFRPEDFKCELGMALLVAPDGKMEIFTGDPRGRKLPQLPSVSYSGLSVDLMDSQLVIATHRVDLDGWWTLTLPDARQSIVAKNWTERKTEDRIKPLSHSSFIHNKDLVYLGGRDQIQVKLQDGHGKGREWNTFNLKTKNGRIFNKFVYDSCAVTIDLHITVIVGGKLVDNDELASKVTIVDMKTQSVELQGNLEFKRHRHACALLVEMVEDDSEQLVEKKSLIVTGGLSGSSTVPNNEIIHMSNFESQPAANSLRTPRYDHKLVQIGDFLYALGGRGSDGVIVRSVEKYNKGLGSWSFHATGLLGPSMAGFAVTTLPISAIESHPDTEDCRPGVAARIVGGSEAQVISWGLDRWWDY